MIFVLCISCTCRQLTFQVECFAFNFSWPIFISIVVENIGKTQIFSFYMTLCNTLKGTIIGRYNAIRLYVFVPGLTTQITKRNKNIIEDILYLYYDKIINLDLSDLKKKRIGFVPRLLILLKLYHIVFPEMEMIPSKIICKHIVFLTKDVSINQRLQHIS